MSVGDGFNQLIPKSNNTKNSDKRISEVEMFFFFFFFFFFVSQEPSFTLRFKYHRAIGFPLTDQMVTCIFSTRNYCKRANLNFSSSGTRFSRKFILSFGRDDNLLSHEVTHIFLTYGVYFMRSLTS